MSRSQRRYDTDIVHAGEVRQGEVRSLTTPIARSALFVFDCLADYDDYAAKKLVTFEYARTASPTAATVERKLAALDSAEAAIVLSSGMAALNTVFLSLLSTGDHLLLTDDGYKRTLKFSGDTFPRWGIEVELADSTDPLAGVRERVRPNTKIVFTEAPSNPHLRLADLRALADLVHAHGALLVVDSTIASPYNLRPLEFGADLVVHSATKFLGGHNDVVAGAICGSEERIGPIRDFHINLGALLDPEGCYLLLRGIKTLGVRVERCNASALEIARWLDARPEVDVVYYPGLPSHPCHELAKRQMRGFGGMMSFELKSDLKGVGRFVDALEVICLGPSLGGVESLIYHPGVTVRHDMTDEERARFGLVDQLVRLSVGVEDPADLIADLEAGFAAMAAG